MKNVKIILVISALVTLSACNKNDVEKTVDQANICLKDGNNANTESCKETFKQISVLMKKNKCTDLDLINKNAKPVCHELAQLKNKRLDQENKNWIKSRLQ